LPNLVGKYPQGDTTAGTVKSAGLPNITGQIHYKPDGTNAAPTGAFSTISTGGGSSDGAGTGPYWVSFDASRSNPIYGNSDTVTPPTLTVRWIIKAYDAPTPSSAQIDLSQYASDLAARLTREQTPAFNKRDVVTVSGTYTAPVTGWYRIVAKGGGGGGGAGQTRTDISQFIAGNGGGEGGTTIGFERMLAGDTATVIIGAGGAGGADGGDSSVTVNSNTYTGGGGKTNGSGGVGTIKGACGATKIIAYGFSQDHPSGGGNGGGIGNDATQGGGGSGGTTATTGTVSGYAGGNGYAWFEYFSAV
jgi:hypothetical protein